MRVPWGYLKRVVAGAIFGMYMAHLLYFLNPQIDITPARLATVTIAYAIICGLLFGSILWGLRVLRVRILGRPNEQEYRRHGFGLVALAATISVLVYWVHLFVFRIYLPLGAVRILSKATNVIGGTAFALIVLWLFERNARRNISRAIFVIGVCLIAISSFFLYQRRDRYRTDTKSVVVANVGTIAGERPVIVVAIRNLPFDWLVTMIGEGSLPWFENARAEGYFTRIEPFTTNSPKAIWASMATGQLPNRHGVTGRFSYHTPLNAPDERFLLIPAGVGFAAWGLIPPVERISAQLPAGQSVPLWMMFERLGLDSAVIAWPSADRSPRSSASVLISQDFVSSAGREGTAAPPERRAAAQRVTISGEAIPPAIGARFDSAQRGLRSRILTQLAADLSVTRLTLRLLRSDRFALSVAALNGLSEVEELIRLDDNVLPARGTPEGDIIRAYVEQLDTCLRQIASASPESMILIVSPSGPQAPRLVANPLAMIEAVIESQDPGRDDGFLLISGADASSVRSPKPAQVVDLVPTALFAAGLPVARDLDGRVIAEAFSEAFLRENSLSIIQTYQADTLVARRPPAAARNPADSSPAEPH